MLAIKRKETTKAPTISGTELYRDGGVGLNSSARCWVLLECVHSCVLFVAWQLLAELSTLPLAWRERCGCFAVDDCTSYSSSYDTNVQSRFLLWPLW